MKANQKVKRQVNTHSLKWLSMAEVVKQMKISYELPLVLFMKTSI